MAGEKKTITVVVGRNGEKERFDLSNDTEFSTLLGYLQAFSLRNESTGSLIFGFHSLENGPTYTVGTYETTHFQELSPSNVRGEVQLDRSELVNSILDRANPIVIIRSPPRTGKTSLLDLIERYLTIDNNINRVVRLSLSKHRDENLVTLLDKLLGVSHHMLRDALIASWRHLWILIDDAQLVSAEESFWKVVIRDFEAIGCKNLHVVIATTHDLVCQNSCPFHFGEYPHIKLSNEEAATL